MPPSSKNAIAVLTGGIPVRLFDSHLHLQDPRLAPYLDDVISKAIASGLRGCRTCGTSPADWANVAAFARRPQTNVQLLDTPSPQRGELPHLRSPAITPHSSLISHHSSLSFQILPAFGVHPWFADNLPADWLEQLEKFLTDFPDAPVGEIGLDGLRPSPSAEIQKKVFTAQLDLAAKLNRPVILHGARVWNELFESFKPFADKIQIIQLHAFSGSPEQMRDWLKTDAAFSIGGVICNPKATRIREMVTRIPKDRLLFETDSPDMFPNGGTSASPDDLLNQPSNLTCIVSAFDIFSPTENTEP